MKIKKILPKVKSEVVIPSELLHFIKINIYQAYINNQDEAVLESDDGIQNEIACAGLIDPIGKKFIVTYYPLEDSQYRWCFNLSLDELKEINHGNKKTLTLWNCTGMDCQNKDGSKDSVCLIHDFVDDGTGESELVKNIHKLSVKEMLDLAYGPKKDKV